MRAGMHVGVVLALAWLDFNRDWIEMAVPHATLIVLHAHQALCQLTLVMVIDVTQHAHAILRRFLFDSLI
jgi:hypothetical protein